jgi:hypothetical protein
MEEKLMRNYKPKYASDAMVKQVEQWANEGHTDTLVAFGADCVHEYNKSLTRTFLIAAGIGAVVGAVSGVIKGLKDRRKDEAKLSEEESKTE